MDTKSQLRNDAGELDVEKVAAAFGIPLDELEGILRISENGVASTPAASALQAALRPFERAYRLTELTEGTPEVFRSWLLMPLEELEDDTPMDVLREGNVEVIAQLVESLLHGDFV
jgi:uncharacterized protein (DUF2384 family)